MRQVQDSFAELPDLTWRKSRHSGKHGNCVELATLPARDVAVRNSRFPHGPALLFSTDEMSAFIADIKDGAFDDLVAHEPG